MENVRNCLGLEVFKKDHNKNFIKQQSKINFNGVHKSYENCVSYAFKQNEVLMDKPLFVGFV